VKKFVTDLGRSITAADRAAAEKMAAEYGLGAVVAETAAPAPVKPLRYALTDGEGGFSPPIPPHRLAAAVKAADEAGAPMTPIVLLPGGRFRLLSREEKQVLGLPVPRQPAFAPLPPSAVPYGGDDFDDGAPRGFFGARQRYFGGRKCISSSSGHPTPRWPRSNAWPATRATKSRTHSARLRAG
jgi:hypothetical protein